MIEEWIRDIFYICAMCLYFLGKQLFVFSLVERVAFQCVCVCVCFFSFFFFFISGDIRNQCFSTTKNNRASFTKMERAGVQTIWMFNRIPVRGATFVHSIKRVSWYLNIYHWWHDKVARGCITRLSKIRQSSVADSGNNRANKELRVFQAEPK